MNLEKLLKEKWSSRLRNNFVDVEGCMLGENFLKLKDKIEDLDIKNDDIWVCSFPKSGTTWLQEITWLIANNLDFDGAKENLEIRFPFLDLKAVTDYSMVKEKDPTLKPPAYRDYSFEYAINQKSRRFIKTHLPFHLLPNQIQSFEKTPKILYIIRDPRDICVSLFHHFKILEDGFKFDFDEFCELFLAGKVPWGPYWNHVLNFWKLRNKPNILLLRYEDMKKDSKMAIRQVANFLGYSLTEDQVQKLSNYTSFESMKNNTAVNKNEALEFLKSSAIKENVGEFLRKGIVGDFKNVMTSDIQTRFDEWITENIKNTDYIL